MRGAVDEVEAKLRALGRAERADKERAYLKSQLRHLGVTVPAIRKVAREAFRGLEARGADCWPMIEALWGRGIYELRVAAVEIATLAPPARRDLPRVEALIRDSHTWALVDPLAINVAGGIVEKTPAAASTLDRWARDDDFWIRRAALLALLRPLRRGEGGFERFGRYADRMLDEKEFFIRKAIGWVLRERARKRPDEVRGWLTPRIARASGVTVREAVRHLPAGEREQLLAAYRASRSRGSR